VDNSPFWGIRQQSSEKILVGGLVGLVSGIHP